MFVVFCPSSMPVFLQKVFVFCKISVQPQMCEFWFKCITVTIEIFLVLSTCGCNSRFSPPERLWVGKDGWAGLCRVMGRGGHSCPLYSSSRLSEFTHASISMYSSPTRARFDDLLIIGSSVAVLLYGDSRMYFVTNLIEIYIAWGKGTSYSDSTYPARNGRRKATF